MLCSQCGAENRDGNHFCTQCGFDFSVSREYQSNQNAGNGQQPNRWESGLSTWESNPANRYKTAPFHSHLAMSIVAIFFFTILGIIATVMSTQANNAYLGGDITQAESKAQTAMVLSIISYVLGGLLILSKIGALAQ